ncbi:hypothetical protein K1719_013861 [Acacia pycnantha]|nr:hypothetical protein K1719_013861 [Acacia pycnantha]
MELDVSVLVNASQDVWLVRLVEREKIRRKIRDPEPASRQPRHPHHSLPRRIILVLRVRLHQISTSIAPLYRESLLSLVISLLLFFLFHNLVHFPLPADKKASGWISA